MNKFVMGLSSLMLISSLSHAQVSLSADSQSISTKARAIEQEYSQGLREERLAMTYPTNLKMREERKVGIGMAVGGPLGVAGAFLEFNFEDADGAVAGFGTGPGYNSVALAWKHTFEGDYLAPYTTVGYSRWYNSTGHFDGGSSILNRVLTESEKKSGQFGADFITGSIGLQYNQLSGEVAGLSVYAELVALAEVKRSQFIPSGTVGALYYF